MTDRAIWREAIVRQRTAYSGPERRAPESPSLLDIAAMTVLVIAAFFAVFVSGPIFYYWLGGS